MWWVLLIMTTVNADFKDNLLSLLHCVQGKGLMSSSVWLSPELGLWPWCKDHSLPTNVTVPALTCKTLQESLWQFPGAL